MSEPVDIDNLFAELVKNVGQKIEQQQNEITAIKLLQEKKEVNQNLSTDLKNYIDQKLSEELNKIKHGLVGQQQSENVEQKQNVNNDDLTLLPAYTSTELFKEVRRPKNINELYMMVIQLQRTVTELQTAVDNISRRN